MTAGESRSHGLPPRAMVWWAARQPIADLDLTPLSSVELDRIARLRTQSGRERSALARVVLRAALADLLGGDDADFDLDWRAGPQLRGGGVDVSLSHSADRVVVALSTAGAVGVDIEAAARAGSLRPAVIERVTAPSERAALAALPLPERAPAALRLWTAKEAVLKATRDGLIVEPRTVEFAGASLPGALVGFDAHPGLVGACQLTALGREDYVGSLAVLSAGPVPIDERDAARLLR